MHQMHGSSRHSASGRTSGDAPARRITTSLFLSNLTAADGEWLDRALPQLLRRARPQSGAVRVEDVALRYRPGHLSVADALDATAVLFAPLASAGASIERRGEWFICDEDDDDDEDFLHTRVPSSLDDTPQEDLLVSARVLVDANGDDAGAAALYWAVLALGGL